MNPNMFGISYEDVFNDTKSSHCPITTEELIYPLTEEVQHWYRQEEALMVLSSKIKKQNSRVDISLFLLICFHHFILGHTY
jgi:hypothetical protein